MIFELKINQIELKQVMLGLVACRNPVKKGFLKSYGFFDGRKKLEIYDNVKDKFIDLYNEDETEQIFYVELNAAQVDMLASFLNFYIGQIKKETLTTENHLIVAHLERTFDKVKVLDEMITDQLVEQSCMVN